MTEICLFACMRPRSYKRMMDEVYPKGASGIEKNLEAQKLGRLLNYAASYPKKIPDICKKLKNRILTNLRNQRYGFLKIDLDVFAGLVRLRGDMHFIKPYLYASLNAVLRSRVSTYISLVHDLVTQHAADIDLKAGDIACLLPAVLSLCTDSGTPTPDVVVLLSMKLALVIVRTLVAGSTTTILQHIPALATLVHGRFHALNGFLDLYAADDVDQDPTEELGAASDQNEKPVPNVRRSVRNSGTSAGGTTGTFQSPKKAISDAASGSVRHAPVLAEGSNENGALNDTQVSPLSTHELAILILACVASDSSRGLLRPMVHSLLDSFDGNGGTGVNAANGTNTSSSGVSSSGEGSGGARANDTCLVPEGNVSAWRDRRRCLQILDITVAASASGSTNGVVSFVVLERALEKVEAFHRIHGEGTGGIVKVIAPEKMQAFHANISVHLDTATHLLESLRRVDSAGDLIMADMQHTIATLVHLIALLRAAEYFHPESPFSFPSSARGSQDELGIQSANVDGELGTYVPDETATAILKLMGASSKDLRKRDDSTRNLCLLPCEGNHVDPKHPRRGCEEALQRYMRELLMQVYGICRSGTCVKGVCFVSKVLMALEYVGGSESGVARVLGAHEADMGLWLRVQTLALLRSLLGPTQFDVFRDRRVEIDICPLAYTALAQGMQHPKHLMVRPCATILQDLIAVRDWSSRDVASSAKLGHLRRAFFAVLCTSTGNPGDLNLDDHASNVAACWRLQALLLNKRGSQEVLDCLPYLLAIQEYWTHLASAMRGDEALNGCSISHAVEVVRCQKLFFCVFLLHVGLALGLEKIWRVGARTILATRADGMPRALTTDFHLLEKFPGSDKDKEQENGKGKSRKMTGVIDLIVVGHAIAEPIARYRSRSMSGEKSKVVVNRRKSTGLADLPPPPPSSGTRATELNDLAGVEDVLSRDEFLYLLLENSELGARKNEVEEACHAPFDVSSLAKAQ